jgi:hypothetical protein
MPATYEKIASSTLGSATSSITFSSIPGTYTDLVCVLSGTHTGSGNSGLYVRLINGDTGTNYSATTMYNLGSAVAGTDLNVNAVNVGCISSVQSDNTFHFMNYSNTTTYKTFFGRGNVVGDEVEQSVALWRNTAAITSFTLDGATFATGTTTSLYGIKAA